MAKRVKRGGGPEGIERYRNFMAATDRVGKTPRETGSRNRFYVGEEWIARFSIIEKEG